MCLPFDLHSAIVSHSHLPCHVMPMPRPCRALTLPFFSRPRHSTACGLPARVRLLPATTRSSTKIVIRSIPIWDAGSQSETKVCHGRGKEW